MTEVPAAADDPAPSEAIVRRYLNAFTTADADRISSCVADEFVNEHLTSLGTGSRGRAEYQRRLPGFLEQFTQLAYHVDDCVVDGHRVVVRYLMSATHQGTTVSVPGMMWFETNGNLITRRTDVWDSLTFLRQIGAVSDVNPG